MGYVELPLQAPPQGGKLTATLMLDPDELRVTVGLLKDALAELTRGMANGVTPHAAAPQPPAARAPPAAAAPGAGQESWGSGVVEGPPPVPAAAPASRAGLPAHLANMQPPPQQQQQQQQAPPRVQAPPPQQPAMRPPPQQAPPAPRPQAPQQQQQQPAAAPPRAAPVAVPAPAPVPVAAPVAAPVPARPAAARQQPPPPPQPQQQWQAQAPAAPQPAAPQQQAQQQQAVGAADASPAPASSHWQQAFATEPEDHNGQTVAAVAYAKALQGLPGGDGHAGWLVTSSKGMINLWETSRAVPGETVLLCMHSQAVDFTCSKLVLEPGNKLMFAASLASDALECVSVHSLDVELGLLAYRYKFGPPVQQKSDRQRLMQQVVSLHGMNAGVRHTVMCSYGERLLLFSTKDSTKVPPNTLVHQSKMHFVAHPGSTITALQTSAGIEGCHNLISGAMDGKIHIWDLSQPPRDNSPALRLYRHTQSITGLAQITDERLVSGSMDGSVMLWDLRYPSGPLFTQRTPGSAGVMRIAPGPWGDVMAVSTAKGLHCVELFDFDAPMTNITAFPLQRPFTDLVFNAVTHDLYAGTATGAISVFSRRA